MSKKLMLGRSDETIQTPIASHGGILGSVLSHAPALARNWGAYNAYSASIAVTSILTLSIIDSEKQWVLLVIVLAALWSPLFAKRFHLFD